MTANTRNSFTIIKAVYDLTFTLNGMPLRRSTVIDLGVEPTVRFPVFKYGSWTLQAITFITKVYGFLLRSVTVGLSVYSVLHFVGLLQLLLGVLATTVTIVKADEALAYFRFHRSLIHKFCGKRNFSPTRGNESFTRRNDL